MDLQGIQDTFSDEMKRLIFITSFLDPLEM